MSSQYDTQVEELNSETGEICIRPRRFIRTPYLNRPPRQVMKFDPDLKRTKDEFIEQCDVNKIWANFVKTGRLDQLQKAKGFYADLTNVPQTYQESLNLVLSARDTFEALPADVRNAFGNNVQAFLHAAEHNPEGLFEALEAIQPIDGSAATPVAPPKPQPPPAPSNGEIPPSNNPAS